MNVTDEEIAAFADGELSGEELAQVEAAITADPELARKVDAHRALKAKLGAHFASILEQPVPDNLASMLKQPEHTSPDDTSPDDTSADDNGADVVSFAKAHEKRGLAPVIRRWAPIAGPALAASLVLVLWQPWQSDTPDGYAGPQLASTLDTQLAASQPADADTRILLSFENDGGALCRAYRGGGIGGIACRDNSGWKIEREIGIGDTATTEFRQAGSEAELLEAAQEMANGRALDAEAEAEARKRDWSL